MPLKDISYLELCNLFVQGSGTICAIGRGIKRKNSVNLFRIGASGSGGDVVKKMSYLELWQTFFSMQPNLLCNLERWYHGEHSCEVI